MFLFTVKRFFYATLTLAVLGIVVFFALRIAPGGPVAFLMGPDQSNREREAAIAKNLGLDQPLPIQLWRWLGNMAKGDFGYSYFHRQDTLTVISERFPATLELALVCFTLAIVVGVGAGALAAYFSGSLFDKLVCNTALIILAVPSVWMGLLLIVIFAATLKILPSAGQETLGNSGNILDHLVHLILPSLSLSAGYIATFALNTREVVAETLSADYIRTARAKGLSENWVVYRHAIRNALIPIISLGGMALPDLLGGSAVVEAVFAWPGIGQLMVDSFGRRDYPVVLAISMLAAVTVLFCSWLSDVLYHLADPRIKYG
ncbi:MAG: ABC transporter permease [Chloroflexi bacterium]|uniref:ABC transporter permease n=1 Tax=Candidatus Chlorohelix allophototropha TaxID=3003348 RepID=A0A8T7M6A4_9CHLR|nr:ABC transporter permease [Chloroflexota bacterium]WJW69536.1 ABC transporter permease [Chloroflexota bacterium L227-S17]